MFRLLLNFNFAGCASLLRSITPLGDTSQGRWDLRPWQCCWYFPCCGTLPLLGKTTSIPHLLELFHPSNSNWQHCFCSIWGCLWPCYFNQGIDSFILLICASHLFHLMSLLLLHLELFFDPVNLNQGIDSLFLHIFTASTVSGNSPWFVPGFFPSQSERELLRPHPPQSGLESVFTSSTSQGSLGWSKCTVTPGG